MSWVTDEMVDRYVTHLTGGPSRKHTEDTREFFRQAIESAFGPAALVPSIVWCEDSESQHMAKSKCPFVHRMIIVGPRMESEG